MSYFQENRTLLEHIAHKKQQLREEKKRDYINEVNDPRFP